MGVFLLMKEVGCGTSDAAVEHSDSLVTKK